MKGGELMEYMLIECDKGKVSIRHPSKLSHGPSSKPPDTLTDTFKQPLRFSNNNGSQRFQMDLKRLQYSIQTFQNCSSTFLKS